MSVRRFIPLTLLFAVSIGCNQFPPISGREAEEANEVVYALQDSLKATKAEAGVSILGRGGNRFVSVYVYGMHEPQAQQGLVTATRTYVNTHPLRKDVHLSFYDAKRSDGSDGSLLYACVVSKHTGP